MTYTEKKYLTAIEMKADEESISIEELKQLLIEFPSNIIYCEVKGKLFGIISTGDILRAYKSGMSSVTINKRFSYLHVGEYMRARTIFREKQSINALPVVSEDNTLIGDYTRWDDIQWLKSALSTGAEYCVTCWSDGQTIALVRPSRIFEDKLKMVNILKKQFMNQNVSVQCIDYLQVIQCFDSFDMFLFSDENEIFVFRMLLYITLQKDNDEWHKLKTYKSVFTSDDFQNKSYTFYLEKVQDQGVDMLGLVLGENAYYQKLAEALQDKFDAAGEEMWKGVIPKSTYKQFFDDLYSEEYVEEIKNIQANGFENNMGILRLKDCKSKYYNVVNGERCTVDQPEEYLKSIYFVGPCYILGGYADDSHTIESLLQECIHHAGYNIRVVNCGCWGMGYCYSLARIAVMPIRKGDIIVIDRPPDNITKMRYVDLNTVLEKNNVGAEWLNDWSLHCNHKVYKLYSDAIYEALEPILKDKVENQGELIDKDDNYIKFLYLDRYFTNFDFSRYERIGSIVMNCNPFTYGHRYLIETALENVDFLIIFVVEEDLSIFSFVERFAMVCEGVFDLQNVIVVPSGPFILSQISFPEYFIKETSEDIVEHTEQDVITFAEKIAPQLGIKYRFVGEEPEDSVTKQYNLAMKKILPCYGIKLIEIPRKTQNGKYISASLVRRYMEVNDRDRLMELLPETTRKILGII